MKCMLAMGSCLIMNLPEEEKTFVTRKITRAVAKNGTWATRLYIHGEPQF